MKFWISGAFALVMALQAGCASLVSPADINAPLKLALTEPVDRLNQRADAGEAPALYAMSFLHRYGLRDVAEDQVRSETLRALAARPTHTMITQYIPGINGAAGRTSLIPITLPGISDAQARRLDMCGLTLLMRTPQMGAAACGASQAYIDLIPAAAAVLAAGPLLLMAAAPVNPSAVADCGATDALWSDAGRRFGGGDLAGAAIATDRIIALCGADEASWHARVMRALIATDAAQPALALQLLDPVPRPAPTPIGSYASFVAMQAQAAAGDWATYATERDTLMRASLNALEAEPGARRAGEAFEVEGSTVHLFERPSPMMPGLDALMVGVVLPTGEKDAPRAFYLTVSPDILDGSKRQYFLDEYRCDGRSTLHYFRVLPDAPDVAAVRALIERRLRGDLVETSGSSFNRGLSACQFPGYVAPGLGDG